MLWFGWAKGEGMGDWLQRATKEVFRVINYILFGAGLYSFQNSKWTPSSPAFYIMLFTPEF